MLHGNTACTHLPHLTGSSSPPLPTVTPAPGCRWRFSSDYSIALTQSLDLHGRRNSLCTASDLAPDGSSFSMSDRPELQAAFGQPGAQKKGCGFPVAHILALFEAESGFLQRIIPSPLRTHDMANAADMHAEMREGDLLVADRGLASFTHLALICRRNCMRLPLSSEADRRFPQRPQAQEDTQGACRTADSRWLKRLGKNDQLVEYAKPRQKPEWLSRADFDALPDTLVVRELRFAIACQVAARERSRSPRRCSMRCVIRQAPSPRCIVSDGASKRTCVISRRR